MKALPTLLLVVPLLPACVAGGVDANPPMDVHSFARPELVRVTHVSLDLELDFERRRALGTAELRLERNDPDAPLVLDSVDLEVAAVRGTDGSARDFSFGEVSGRLGQPLRIELAPDDTSVVVEYATAPGAVALQWLEPHQTAGGKQPFLFTQGQSILTRSWIPLQDSPGVRVTYDARIAAPEGITVVMSAEESWREDDGRFAFRLTKSIPPYLIALGAGDLELVEISDRCGVWADPTIAASAAAELEDTEAMIQRAEELFGPYRWGRYDILILPPAFPFGGMENPCMTFATPTILAGDKSLVSLVAHELAHSWSGNLVTNATWSDFWLNEGFTVYFEARIMEEVFGEERADLEKALAYDDIRRELEELEPWAQVLRIDLDGRHPDEGFSGVPYEKGALFLRRLEEIVGRERFDVFLRGWFDEHAFESVTTDTFLAWLERELPEASGEIDVAEWMTGEGLPADAPETASSAMAAVDVQVERARAGATPAELETDGWVTQQWLAFLEARADDLDAARMTALDEAFGLTATHNSEVLCVWLRLSVQHGYSAADERLEQFLAGVGRAKFLKPIYKELGKQDRERALALYERNRSRYHSVATAALDRILGLGG